MQTTPGKRSAFTRVELLIVLSICAVLSVGVIFQVNAIRTQQRLARCADNLKQSGIAMYTFADSHHDDWPMTAPREAFASGGRTIRYAPGTIGLRRETEIDPERLQAGEGEAVASTTRGLWRLLHLRSGLTTQTFVCPLSGDVANADPDPTKFWDFRSYAEVSYGYQVPFGKYARPSADCDSRMPLVADKGPYGAALEAGASDPGPPAEVPRVKSSKRSKLWRPWTSPNHGGRGLTVLYADSHANPELWPTVGVAQDNIYTRWSTPLGEELSNRFIGTPPTGVETPMSQTDTLIYP